LRALIRRMSIENPLWGAPRIHGELLKLGLAVAQSSVAKYMDSPSRSSLHLRADELINEQAFRFDGVLMHNWASPGMPLPGTNAQCQRALRNHGEAEMSCVRPNRRE
jgi:hypothetical protein